MQDRSQYHQRGSVLIVTLVVLSLISVMVSNLVYQTRLELQIQQRVNSLTALRGTARGAVHQFASFMGIHVEETSNGPALEWWVDDTALRPIDSESGTTVIVSGEEHLVTNGEQVAATDDRDDPNLEENSTGSGLADAESRLNINVATPEQFMAFPGFSNILAEEIVRHREMLRDIPHPLSGSVRQVVSPLNFRNAPLSFDAPPPLLGQHTQEVLQALDLGETS